MEGKVLGFDPAAGEGAIKGNDGGRYTFAVAEWRSAGQPRGGEEVDFETEGSAAKNIYATRGAGGLNIDLGNLGAGLGSGLGGGAAGAASSDLGRQFLSSWSPTLAVATLVLCLFPFVSGGGDSENLFGAISVAKTLKQALSGFSALGAFFGGPSEPPAFVGTLKFFLSLYPLFYLIPAAAVWVLVFAFLNKPLRLPSLALGIAAAGLPILLIVVANIMVSASMPSDLRELGGDQNPGAGMGFGAWLLVLVGVAQLLALFGLFIRKTPAELLAKG